MYSLFFFFALTVGGFAEYIITQEATDFIADLRWTGNAFPDVSRTRGECDGAYYYAYAAASIARSRGNLSWTCSYTVSPRANLQAGKDFPRFPNASDFAQLRFALHGQGGQNVRLGAWMSWGVQYGFN